MRKVQPDDADDILDLERAGEVRIPHIPAGRVVQLDLLQVKLRGRKAVIGPGMVIMHMGEDDVLDRAGVDPDERQRLRRAAQMPPPARRGDLRGKSGVDDDRAVRRDRDPDEIIHRHRPVMRVAADKVVGAPGVALGVADRVELVFGEMGVHQGPHDCEGAA